METKNKPEKQIEEILQKYPESKSYIELHSEIKITTTISETPTGTGRTGSKVETKAIRNVEPRQIVMITEAILAASDDEEKKLIDLHYFKKRPMWQTAQGIFVSERTAWNIRKNMLIKALGIVTKKLIA